MKAIKVLLVEDHTIVRKGLRSLLEHEPGIEVAGEAEDGREAIKKVQQEQPDIVLMDISMPGLNGIEAARLIKKALPKTKVLMLSVHVSEEYVFQALRARASGYVIKKAAPAELIAAIRAVHRGELFITPTISGRIIQNFIMNPKMISEKEEKLYNLTSREREVLQLVAEGRTNRKIADLLHISIKTVQTHRASIMDKLGKNSTAELTQFAICKGLINPDF